MTVQTCFPEIKQEKLVVPLKQQLLKWIGNKQRFAREIVSFFPEHYATYHEPFLGSGAVLGTLNPAQAYASDIFEPLMGIWKTLSHSPELLKRWYSQRWQKTQTRGKEGAYEMIKASYNASPNSADLLFLCRSCYGGVIRFRKADGYMSTPCGIHNPISPESFAMRVDLWSERTKNVHFRCLDFRESLENVKRNDLVYCDPPYFDSQSILYGAQAFNLNHLYEAIENCKRKGAYVLLSIDGNKRSGNKECDIPIPEGLFRRELFVHCGPSMLKRFQMEGRTLEKHHVADRLLATY